jgi:hypothetical protein
LKTRTGWSQAISARLPTRFSFPDFSRRFTSGYLLMGVFDA